MPADVTSRDGGRGPVRFAATAAAVLAVTAACGPGLPPRGVVTSEGVTPPSLPPSVSAEADAQVADPVRLRIPAIGVDAPVGPLEVDAHNVLPPPETNEGTGWWRGGPEPGERGPAVIVGHVDSYQGPAVFFRLSELEPGQEILVERADGSTAGFVVARLERHAKDAFPTETVYGDTAGAELRLVTCGGEFAEQDRRYLDNVIVYAHRSR
ncbi:class F sortase [Prauserella cavernicola]|uniref:Class F sortase n=1 Tax=Prauserella cavernicola TaxID=2800127 RepID=A0A934QMD4_9PSEU|nr:class F sortase [Prauserella cavernicola]MBK1783111.1 class F sortase [Prauserella cavernicola]